MNGKGDSYRSVDRKKWEKNYEKIFGKKRRKKMVRNKSIDRGDLITLHSGEKAIVSELQEENSLIAILENGIRVNTEKSEIRKVVKRAKVPTNTYLGKHYRSWRVRAFGYERKSLEEELPLLLDRVTVRINTNYDSSLILDLDSYELEGYVVAHTFDMNKYQRFFVLLIDVVRNITHPGDEKLLEHDLQGETISISVEKIIKIERTPENQLMEFLVHDNTTLRELAHDIYTGKEVRTTMEGW